MNEKQKKIIEKLISTRERAYKRKKETFCLTERIKKTSKNN